MAESADELKLSGVAISFNFIAAILLVTTGIITAFYGAWGLLFGGPEQATETFITLSARTWGAVHFGIGVGMIMAGGNLFVGRFWARWWVSRWRPSYLLRAFWQCRTARCSPPSSSS